MIKKDGKSITEEIDIKTPALKPVSVFDVSRIEGKPLPALSKDLTGNVEQYNVLLEALKDVSVMSIGFKPLASDVDGFCNFDSRNITITFGLGLNKNCEIFSLPLLVLMMHFTMLLKLFDYSITSTCLKIVVKYFDCRIFRFDF